MNKNIKQGIIVVLWLFSGGMLYAIVITSWPKEVEQVYTFLSSFLPSALAILILAFILIFGIGILYFVVQFLKSFFENPFRKRYIPTPSQDIPGIQPLIVQAIENLFPNRDDQKYAFDYVLKLKEKGKGYDTKIILALLSRSNGNIENLLGVDSPYMGNYHYMEDMIVPIFPKMKDAEEWVKSITKS